MIDAPLGERVASAIARNFRHHLQAELARPDGANAATTFGGKTARQIDQLVLKKLQTHFPELEQSSAPSFDLMARWLELNHVGVAQHAFFFEAYNQIFLERILRLKAWGTDADGAAFRKLVYAVFETYEQKSRQWCLATFLKLENTMRQVLREVVRQTPEVDSERAWDLICAESSDYQVVVSGFFEQLRHRAYDETQAILLRIMPREVAHTLKTTGRFDPIYVESATVLFADFVGFTAISSGLTPQALVAELDYCFSMFDEIAERHGLQKIKTIGDSYMCVCGIFPRHPDHALRATKAALEMQRELQRINETRTPAGHPGWSDRIGLHSGPLVAGVIGNKSLSFDVWGDTVNTASRMESASEPGRVNVSAATHALIAQHFDCQARGSHAIKGKGLMDMYFVVDSV